MTTFLTILVILLCLGSIIGLVMFFRSRKLLREQKNYERGLKMVPLLIHLPPLSEDTEIGGRDVRDVVDENISKAQVLYNIIASTLKKGFKSKFYGQRHFAFEIVASKGVVHFYAAVPVVLVEVVKQAVVSAYPSARLEEVAEHNIFSPVGRISGSIGGELTLKENFAYPIATYQDLKRDAMQSMLNALSTLDKEDGAGIQILIRPADPGWRKKASGVAGKKRKGKDKKSGVDQVFAWSRDIITALAKPPEEKPGGPDDDKKELSPLEQSILDAIDDKTRHPGYEVLIRVVASSNISQRAQSILNNIVATFALFDAPGKNGFKFTPAKDIDSFITAYILRFFPPENKNNILNAVELATIFHFPDQRNTPTTQLERQQSKQVDGPRNISEEGLLLGYNIFRGVKKPIRLSNQDRRRHMYIVGQTGTGKSTLLENLVLQDMLAGRGFAFIDPHGDAAERLLSMVPKERTEDVIYFCPADMDYPMGLNLFEFHSPEQKDFLIQEAINMLYKLYDPQHQGIIGPRYEHWFRNAALTVMSNPEGGTFIDIPKVFTDKQYERQLKAHVTDQTVLDFWNKEMAQTSDYHKSEVLGWFVSKFGAFLSNEMMRNIIGQRRSAFNLRKVMDEGKILLVNLSKGRSGELNSKLLGMIFVMKFQAAAMSRANIADHEERSDFSLYVDEFQNFSTDSFADILSEARKYGLNLVVANQFTTQLSDEIRDAVFGNVGSIVSFRVGTNDAEFLAKQYAPIFDVDDLQRIPNFNSVVRMLISGVPAQPFSMATMPPLGTPNRELGKALKQLSAAKYGRPKSVVEKEIFDRLRTEEPPKPAFPPPGAGAAGGQFGSRQAYGAASPYGAGAAQRPLAAPGSVPKAGTSGSSFLDEWLAKRRSPTPSAIGPKPFGTPAPGQAPVGAGVPGGTVPAVNAQGVTPPPGVAYPSAAVPPSPYNQAFARPQGQPGAFSASQNPLTPGNSMQGGIAPASPLQRPPAGSGQPFPNAPMPAQPAPPASAFSRPVNAPSAGAPAAPSVPSGVDSEAKTPVPPNKDEEDLQAAQKSAADAAAAAKAEPPKKHEGEVNLSGEHTPEDTILIDQQGHMTPSKKAAEAEDPSDKTK